MTNPKTNVTALIALSLFTVIIVGLFVKLQPGSEYGRYKQMHRADSYQMKKITPESTSRLEADVSEALKIDNADDLNTIDNQF